MGQGSAAFTWLAAALTLGHLAMEFAPRWPCKGCSIYHDLENF